MYFQWDDFEFGFNLMKPLGVCRQKMTNRDRVLNVLYLFSVLQIFACSLITLYTLTDYTVAVDSFISTIHMIAKYCWFIYYRPLYANFFKEIYAYWEEMEFDENVKQYIHFVRKMLRRLVSIQAIAVASLITLYGTMPLVYADKMYIFDVGFRVDSTVLNVVILLFQYYCIIVSAHTLVAYDAIYMSLCCYVLIQLKLLRAIIRSLKPTISRSRFVNCVKHHLFILSLVSRIKAQYSFIFLLQYIVTVISVCNQLLLFSGGESKINYQSITAIMYLIYMFLQFWVYCIPAERVGSEVLNLTDVIYSSKWYECFVPQKKEILFIMMATQRNSYFTVGGFMDMNMTAFVAVFKMAFSFHTVINNMLTRQVVGKYEERWISEL